MYKELMAKLSKALSEKEMPYMIIGGHAVILYGEPRFTRDIDITLGAGAERINDILEVVKKINLTALTDDINSFVQKTMVLPVIDNNTGIRVDFIFSFTPYEKEAINRAVKFKFNEIEVNFASMEDVLIHKIFAGRPRDIEDIKSIILKNRDGIDFNYINKWLKEFEETFPEGNFTKKLREILKEVKPS